MKNKFIICIVALSILVLASFHGNAQEPLPSKHLMKEDSAAINALAMYPENIRIDIFEACEYPAAIVNISSLQKNTSADFADLISEYSKEEQEDLWNMSRYPNLISDLVSGGRKSREEINNILANYPQDIHETAMRNEREHYNILVKMNDIQLETNRQFANVIADYPHGTQDALKALIQYPEIFSLLNDHLNMSVRVGDHYRRDPQGVINWLDDISIQEARQNAEDAAEWKKTIESNPDAANDLRSAGNDYAMENGYSQDEMNVAPDPDYVTNYYSAPYSYWFGYPTWYPYSYWYPHPYWYDCGFYYNSYGAMVIIGTPGFGFTNWYFYNGEHCRHYPHLGETYVNHYYGNRRSLSGNGRVVNNWVRDNKSYLPADFKTNRTNRVETIRQVGQLNEDARKEHGGKPVSPEVRDQYIQKNATKYPALNAKVQPKTEGGRGTQSRNDVIPVPETQPHVRITKPEQQQPMRPSEPAQPRQTQPQRPAESPKSEPQQRPNNYNNINRANEYHHNTWEQAQPIQHPQPQAAPRSSSPRSSAPASRPAGGGGGRRR